MAGKWETGYKNIWGKDIWQKIALDDISIVIIEVSVHQKDNSEVTNFNNHVAYLNKKDNET